MTYTRCVCVVLCKKSFVCVLIFFFFFFKQKTAYEMRISDWSSDVCSSDLQYLLDARAYAATLSDLNLAVPADVSSFYTVTVTVSAGLPPLATLSAIPIAGKGQESDGTLSIATDGTKSPTDKW